MFPKGFVWGAATAAAQIEGAAFADGKGESIWDRFARVPGKVRNGDTLDVACDHYHRYRRDVALLKALGLKHYRFSVAWPRVFPEGDGAINLKGLDFYQRLVDALLEAGITPWVTLFHWDLPQALEDRGGWRVRAVPDAFAGYADAVVQALGDRVKHWITLNEIRCFTVLGYRAGGDKAPGGDEPPAVINQTYHHALVCHGQAVRAVREYGGRGAKVGLTDNSDVYLPVTETAADIAAARRLYLESNQHLLDPIYRGSYAPAYLRRCGADRPRVGRGDFDLIGLRTDFLGLNLYTAPFVRAGKGGRPERLEFPAHYPTATASWLRWTPQVAYWGTRFAHEAYAPGPIYITENGIGYEEAPPQGGEVHDLHRREYVRQCLGELHRAIGDGVPVKGYFLWSLLDNYEWQDGYAMRFGLCHTDFQTLERTPKLSARWYAKVVAENRLL